MCFVYIENSIELDGRKIMVNGKDQYARVTESNRSKSKSKVEYSNKMKDYRSIFRLKFFRLALNLL